MGKKSFRIWSATPQVDLDAAAWFWEKMEPHFDYRSGDVGLIVNGRTVQAFARKCPSDEEIVWSRNGSEGKAFIGPSRRWRNTQTGLCVAAAVPPRTSDPPMWLEPMTASDYLAELIKDRQPVIRSNFDVYFTGNSLVYEKQSCRYPTDVEAPFFVHVFPMDRNDLPDRRRQFQFDNLDFRFRSIGREVGGTCFAIRHLPDYPIAAIRTGQYTGGGQVWEGNFDITEQLDDGEVAP